MTKGLSQIGHAFPYDLLACLRHLEWNKWKHVLVDKSEMASLESPVLSSNREPSHKAHSLRKVRLVKICEVGDDDDDFLLLMLLL